MYKGYQEKLFNNSWGVNSGFKRERAFGYAAFSPQRQGN